MNSENGRDMDSQLTGSIQRARERAAAGLPRPPLPPDEPQIARPSVPQQPGLGLPRGPRQQPPFPLQRKDGQAGVSISRPVPAPQWPLPGSVPVQDLTNKGPSKAPAPQRPPRPSRVPSILDSSKVQEQTPTVFRYRRDSNDQDMPPAETLTNTSRPSTLSSVGSIPDFPLPMQMTPGPPRRGSLGPPPSARRGASSFYSNASFVSPIPEESPRSRSRASIASSTAIPDSWGAQSPAPSPDFPDNDMILEESVDGDEDAEESRLVANASVGKRAKPTLVAASSARPGDFGPRQEPFQGGTGYVDGSSSDSQATGASAAASATPDAMLNAYYSSASSDDPSIANQPRTAPPAAAAAVRNSRRLSVLRRPPRLDIDAVRAAEARGSLTSLPDLIRRATRLAASLEKGRRPASQFHEDDFPNWVQQEKHRSGLSDMLAAFPPPAQARTPAITGPQPRRSIRASLREQVQSWPFLLSRTLDTSQEAAPPSDDDRSEKSKRRLCCGLPRWMVIVASIVALLIIVAAVVIPIEFLVIRRQENNNGAQQQLQQCRNQLPCANGGTNIIGDDGACTCRCVNGFSGPDCTTFGDLSCTTMALTGSGADGQVTVGNAIPRLVQDALTNYSIPLSANEIISKFEASNLSCSAENALVTFNGLATRQFGTSSPQQVQQAALGDDRAAAIVDGVFFTTVTVVVFPSTTVTLGGGPATTTIVTTVTPSTFTRNLSTTTLTLVTSAPPGSATATRSVITTTTMSSSAPTPSAGTPSDADLFTVGEDALDFARVAVLYVLQQDGLNGAEAAQVALQRFFNSAASTTVAGGGSGAATVGAARNVTIGEGRSVDLVGFFVDLGDGKGRVGGGSGASLPSSPPSSSSSSSSSPRRLLRKRRGLR
ncbi:hypothetical protein VTJ83DRAFT_1724 [Remersonia thermophila]|uniref:EGF-like domain-containing protein n=1 Tax=Remersonia thermophila TaxID=72144 RepID=A0ABR4DGQ2_9PEZI